MRIIDLGNESYYRLSIVEKTKARQVTPSPAPARVKSEALLGEAGILVITHNGREYQLRVTQNGKLILTA